MPIKFPKMHIAESVVNRILNVNDALDFAERAAMAQPGAAAPMAPPNIPLGVEMQGIGLDAQLSQPAPADMAVPPAVGAPSPGGVIRGETIAEGIP